MVKVFITLLFMCTFDIIKKEKSTPNTIFREHFAFPFVHEIDSDNSKAKTTCLLYFVYFLSAKERR